MQKKNVAIHSKNSPPLFSHEITPILQELKVLVGSLPYGELKQRAWKAVKGKVRKVSVADDPKKSLEEILDVLFFEVQMGDPAAAKTLRDAGLRISKELARLIGDPGLTMAKIGHIEPSLELYDEVSQFSLEQEYVLKTNLDRWASFPTPDLKNVLELITRDKCFDIFKVFESPWTDEESPQNIEERPQKDQKEKPLDAPELAEGIFWGVVGRRFYREMVHMFPRLLAKSEAWPITAPSASRDRAQRMEGYVASLGLGAEIPFSQATKSRECSFETAFGRSMDVILKIENVRREAKAYPSPVTDWLKMRYDALCKEEASVKVKTKVSTSTKKVAVDELQARISLIWPGWKLHAAYLPELSTNGKVVDKWISVAMKFLIAECGGELKELNWPGVESDTSGKSRETLISNMLRKALKAIAE